MRIAIIGRTEILYNTAVNLVNAGHKVTCILTAKEAPEYSRKASDFKALSEQWKIPFAQGANIEKHLKFLKESNSDIAISINYSGIIPKSVTDIFPLGILNAHGGDLPKYKGNACQAWAIINGEEKVAICIHKMIGGELDNGNIIIRDYLSIDINTTITMIFKWFDSIIPILFIKAVDILEKEPSYYLEIQNKDPLFSLRCYPRRIEDGLINWKEAALTIIRLINASTLPFEGAITTFEGKKLNIISAELYDDNENYCAIPGQVSKVLCGRGVVVITGNGKILVKTVKIENQFVSCDSIVKSIRNRFS